MNISKRAIIKYVAAALAVLNLVWLFGFNYKLPGFFYLSNSVPETEEVAAAATTAALAEPEEVEIEPEEEEEEEPVKEPEVHCRVTAASNLNVRMGPGTNYEVGTTAAYEEILTVLGSENDWVRIRNAQGQEGYVSSTYIEIIQE